MLNCRPGDLACIVGLPEPLRELIGRFVRCEEFYLANGVPTWRIDRRIDFVLRGGGRSTITGQRFADGDKVFVDSMSDKYLRPIRGTDGEDEMLRIAGRPYRFTTTAIAIGAAPELS